MTRKTALLAALLLSTTAQAGEYYELVIDRMPSTGPIVTEVHTMPSLHRCTSYATDSIWQLASHTRKLGDTGWQRWGNYDAWREIRFESATYTYECNRRVTR